MFGLSKYIREFISGGERVRYRLIFFLLKWSWVVWSLSCSLGERQFCFQIYRDNKGKVGSVLGCKFMKGVYFVFFLIWLVFKIEVEFFSIWVNGRFCINDLKMVGMFLFLFQNIFFIIRVIVLSYFQVGNFFIIFFKIINILGVIIK